ncbi:MAG: UDP-N-acetylmuramoylalanyl-D-glutamate--2,6-diaminopimelate ligase [Verrucomicrobiales bacterium]|nr:UDP-N-acetylmuramoylalanyl-D-glutamate--2,6-diaminopimelate ligase [Verrucomicrobiales bacterium]
MASWLLRAKSIRRGLINMQLRNLLQTIPTLKIEGSLEREVVGITYDSRRVTPGMVFVAIPGLNTDGHEYINTAIDRGAAAVICQTNGFISNRATKVKVTDSRAALARAAAEFYQNPSRKLMMIGVTGTNGKTTVAFMVKAMLEEAGIKAGLISTIHYELGERVIPSHRTTPEALDIQHMLAQMIRTGCTACVMEVSSHALEQKRVEGIEFDVCLFTNLSQDHLDYHGTMDEYFQAKKKLFEAIKVGKSGPSCVINIDDGFGEQLAASTMPEIQLSYGITKPARLRATHLKLAREHTEFVAEYNNQNLPFSLNLIGRHNVYNALAAIGAGIALDIDPKKIQKALKELESVPGRLQRISQGQPFEVFVDYAHTEEALRNTLGTLREFQPRRLLLIFGCGGSRDTGKRKAMGEAAAEMADFSWITNDNPRREDPVKIAANIREGFEAKGKETFEVELDRRSAIEIAIREAKPGDIVLIAGKGHETYQEFEDTVIPFDDRVFAREALEYVGYPIKNDED